MVAIRRLNWWQTSLLITALVFVTWADWSMGSPADRSFAGWTRYLGALTITIGIFLNCVLTRPDSSGAAWRGVSVPVRFLLAGGSLAVVVGFIVGAVQGHA